ncbi:kelch repeat-containing protein [uncultured Aquimarina sp.]|uniref:Kelch repeat-containing protein n=1 Tax=uncultured Aquimarina sp. TaxID=575652 RepID=UPI00262E26F5|nr:kelch repeat-containing protein [uncultured Aquimarina sp.]
MKTSKILLVFLLIIHIACDTEDDDIIIDDVSESSLTFDLKTSEDQMGGFAENTMAVFDGKVWSVGGDNAYTADDTYGNAVWSSDNGINWVSVTSDLFEARYRHTLTVFNNEMWLIGGKNNSGDLLSDIWRSSDGSTWSNVTMTAPFGNMSAHTTTVFNNKMYVIGPSSSRTNMIVWSTIDGVNWVEENANAFPVRGNHETVVFNGSLYVIAGRNETSRFNEIWSSTDGISWSSVATSTPIFNARDLYTATVFNNKVWIINGQSETSRITKDIWHSSDMINWTRYEEVIPFQSSHSHSSLVYDDQIWFFGGYIASGTSGEIWTIDED